MTSLLEIDFPTILRSEPSVSLELASSIKLELPGNAPPETWKELTIIRGRELNVRIKISWDGHIIRNDRFMELFGRAVSKSKLWAQLLFSVSLELPSGPNTQNDIILRLTRVDIDNAAWSSSAVESQIAVHLPTACLSRLSLTASFGSLSRPIVENHLEMPSMLEGEGSEPGRSNHTVLNFLSLLDSAFSSLLVQSLAPTAPCIFSPGYLKLLWHSGKQISSISESFNHVHKITTSMDLKQKILSLTSNDTRGVESALWRLAKSRADRNPSQKDQFDNLFVGVDLGQEGQEGPGTPTNDVLQDDLLWLQDSEGMGEEILEEEMLL